MNEGLVFLLITAGGIASLGLYGFVHHHQKLKRNSHDDLCRSRIEAAGEKIDELLMQMRSPAKPKREFYIWMDE